MKHKRLLVSLLVVFVMSMTLGLVNLAFADELQTNLSDALNNGRVTEEVTAEYKATLAITDGKPYDTRMYYKEKVDLSNFTMNFVIDQFNDDGQLRFDFLTSYTDYASRDSDANTADGLGFWMWDETAWGYPSQTALRPEPGSYSKAEGYKHLDDKALRGGAGNSYVGKNIRFRVWYDESYGLVWNYQVAEGTTDWVDNISGSVALTSLPAGFDYTDCYFVINPDIDSREHSYAQDIKLTIKDVNGVSPAKIGSTKTFAEVLLPGEESVKGRVTISSDYGLKTTLKVTDMSIGDTRACYTKPVVLDGGNSWFEMNFRIDQFNVNGGMRFSFLSSSGDFPMDTYGSGFGIYFWDETAWGYQDLKAFRCDFYKYGKTAGFTGAIEGKAVRSNDNTIIGQEFHIKVWEFDENSIAMQIDRNDNGNIITEIGAFSKTNLPEGFDIKNCVLMITPDVDSNRAESYAKDIVITIRDFNGEDPCDATEYVNVTATAGENGKVVSNFKSTAAKGSNVKFTITPDQGYEIDEATLNGEAVEVTDNVYVAEATTDLAFNVTFKEIEIPEGNITVVAASEGHGSVKAYVNNEEAYSIPEGTEVTFVFDADMGYMLDQVTVNGTAVEVSGMQYVASLTENTTLNVSFKQYAFAENSNFVPGMWDAQKGRVNTVMTSEGEMFTFAVKDKQNPQSRAYSAPIDITKETSISFKNLNMGVGAGFSLSFLATADDYPMATYGDGFRILFKDITTALVATTMSYSRLSGSTPEYLGDGEYTMVNGTDYADHTYTVRIADYNASASTVVVYLDKDGTNVDYFTVNFGTMSMAFDPEACFLLLTPEIDGSLESSWATPVEVLLSGYNVNLTSDSPIIDDEEDEYKITYMKGDKVVKIAYTDAGDKFQKYTPKDADFVGWYADPEFTTEFDFNTPSSADVTVYGKYQAKADNTGKSGCGSSMNTEAFALILVAAAAIILSKKVRKN